MKKSTALLVLITTVVCMFSGCSKAQENLQNKEESISDKNILIVYLSRTKNTKAVAEIIQKNTGGLLVEIELQNPYPTDYKMIVSQVAKENETGYLPPLKTKIPNIEKFDTVFVGFPTWGMQLPPPMKSFLKEYNLEGKTIIPFNTNAGYGIGSSFQTVKELCSKSTVLKGFSVKGGIERDGILFVMEGEKEKEVQTEIKNWLKKIGLGKY
ncbi:flavodoxin [Flavobacterium sp. HSC-32F16]|uniref:flavodoxin family protein n=1 Tax=Flavobacterium sp. HSC-32F16 TaxID=2910964 RepID=UPI0020A54AE6|nr:flavodoxin [Flavobacterium sp. HSC-32F16]MCP2025228.1 flavodoxin [Flavobacterium sp. HSC-32F16]